MQAFGDEDAGAGDAGISISPGVHSGGIVLLSGQIAFRDGRIVGDTIEEQTDVAIDNIAALLAPLGRTLADIAKITVWLTRSTDFAVLRAALRAAIPRALHGCYTIGDRRCSCRNRSDGSLRMTPRTSGR